MDYLPKVSVVVPALNEEARIGGCIEALKNQNYPSSKVEIIVVDNNSTDRTADYVRSLGVTCLFERKQNAEAARNTGVRGSSGEILAFTDADCRPTKDWLRFAVAKLHSADLVAGHIKFSFAAKTPTVWEMYDAVFNLQHVQSVGERGIAFTANLLVRRHVFDELGGFPEDCFGGGDLLLTRKATSDGKTLVFEPEATIIHPARSFRDLAKKAFRIGREKGSSWIKDIYEKSPRHSGSKFRKPHFIGMHPHAIATRMRSQDLRFSTSCYFVLVACNLVYLAIGMLGFINGSIRSLFVKRPVKGVTSGLID